MNLTKGLIRLEKIKYVIFDIIIINTKTEDKDIISNSIIAWNLLNENGIMIFDNYRESYEEEEFVPRISINSFLVMYKEQYNKLTSNYQLIIEKKPNIVSKEKEQEIINIINNYNFESLYIKLNENIEEELEFRLANIELDYDMKKFNELISKIIIYDIHTKKKLSNLTKYLDKQLINYIQENNITNNNLLFLIKYNDIYLELIKNNDYKHIFINSFSLNNEIFNKLFSNFKFNHKFKISFNDLQYTQQCYLSIIETTKKYDFIYFRPILDKSNNSNYLIYLIGIILNIQEYNGICILAINIQKININILLELLFFLKKYYKHIIIKNRIKYIGNYIILKCKYYKHIEKKELIHFNNIILELFKLNINQNINSIINIKNDNYNIIKHKFI